MSSLSNQKLGHQDIYLVTQGVQLDDMSGTTAASEQDVNHMKVSTEIKQPLGIYLGWFQSNRKQVFQQAVKVLTLAAAV